MSVTLKQQLSTWKRALEAYEAQDFDTALAEFETIAEESKILFNIGLIQATIGDHDSAVVAFETAISMDRFLAIAYFQSGVSNFLMGRFPESKRDFDDAFAYLRDNMTIDYEQLGLKFRLYSCEVLFNRGLSSLYMNEVEEGMNDLRTASSQKQTDEHRVVDEAINQGGEGYTVFSIPVGILYRPSANKLKNLETKDYLGQAKLVAATDSHDAFTGFTGVTLARNATKLRMDAVFGDGVNQRSGPGERGSPSEVGMGMGGGLERSKTMGAAYGGMAEQAGAPLRRNQSAAPAQSRTAPPRGPGRARSPDPATTQFARNYQKPQSPSNLPTPPPSDELPLLPSIPVPLQLPSLAPTTPLPYSTPNNRDTTTYAPTSDFIDTYLDDTRSPPPPVPTLPLQFQFSEADRVPEGQPRDRVAKWARQNTGAGAPPGSTAGGLRRGHSANETGGGGGGTIKRTGTMPMRSNTLTGGGGSWASGSRVGEEESTVMGEREMSKVRIKLRYRDDTRGMSISPDMELEDFVERVRRKFESPSDLPMRYKDSDGSMVSIVDPDDWQSALDEARENAGGRSEGKLEIFIDPN